MGLVRQKEFPEHPKGYTKSDSSYLVHLEIHSTQLYRTALVRLTRCAACLKQRSDVTVGRGYAAKLKLLSFDPIHWR
jgi:hypothetical protein